MSLNRKISDWSVQRIWIIGASTGIGAALAEALHAKGARVALSARRAEKLNEIVARLGPARTLALPLDIAQLETIRTAEAQLTAAWGGYDLVVLMAGDYVAMRAWELNLNVAQHMVAVNWGGFLNSLSLVIPRLLAQQSGGIMLVSSVAGYRGLPKSLIYGPTKAALINLAETLYLDLQPRGLNVYLVNPGFVKTPLTDQNDFEMPAVITAEAAAAEIIMGLEAGQFELHFPKRFTRWLKLLRLLPYSLYFPVVRKMTKEPHADSHTNTRH